jgi:hypothetical protein
MSGLEEYTYSMPTIRQVEQPTFQAHLIVEKALDTYSPTRIAENEKKRSEKLMEEDVSPVDLIEQLRS